MCVDMDNTRKRKKRKKNKVGTGTSELDGPNGFCLERGTHGYGVQPLGNMLLTSQGNARDSGLGSLHILTDEVLCDIFGLVSAKDLGCLSLVSRAMYVFCHQDNLWRNLVLEEMKGDFTFNGCWKDTFVAKKYPGFHHRHHVPLKVKHFYSDYLFQSWLCASLEIKKEWLIRDNIERRSKLSLEEFISEFEEPNTPVLITDALEAWPALVKWDRDYLLKHAQNVSMAAGPVSMKLEDYFVYADQVKEERPLYIFDSKFGKKCPQLAADYDIPIYFKDDLFSILGNDRPDFQWLIMGPARSGSSFHIDPNSTSAWNAVIRGSKKWILYPPDIVPPGIYPSADGAEVAAPVSITEWFMNFYQETKHRKEKPIECICRQGELVFVPNGWWHMVINLEDSVAITQNYVSRRNLLNVLEFLSRPNSKDLVSGTNDRTNLHAKFKTKYEELFPGSIDYLKQKTSESKLLKQKLSFWDSVSDAKVGSFKFNFS